MTLHDPPELLPDMMQLMDDGADVVYGQRVGRDGETWFKKVSARTFYRLLLRMTDVPIPQDTGDFRLMSRQVVDALLAMPEYQRFIRGMVAWIGFHQVALQYHRDKRFAGETKYPLGKMLAFALDAQGSDIGKNLRIIGSTHGGLPKASLGVFRTTTPENEIRMDDETARATWPCSI